MSNPLSGPRPSGPRPSGPRPSDRQPRDDEPKDEGTALAHESDEDVVLLDELGHLCPLPVIALGRAVAAHPHRPLNLTIWADDPAARSDIPAWCRMKNAELLEVSDLPNRVGQQYRVRVTS
jgi:TusA-related sulfurtransferase